MSQSLGQSLGHNTSRHFDFWRIITTFIPPFFGCRHLAKSFALLSIRNTRNIGSAINFRFITGAISTLFWFRAICGLIWAGFEKLNPFHFATGVFIAEMPISFDDSGIAMTNPRTDLALGGTAQECLGDEKMSERMQSAMFKPDFPVRGRVEYFSGVVGHILLRAIHV